ncbi:hypothetical protein BH09VER1_BH09VER1_51830 [soil metagenome]
MKTNRHILLVLFSATLGIFQSTYAANLYFTGDTGAYYNWTAANWNTAADGSGSQVSWIDGSDAYYFASSITPPTETDVNPNTISMNSLNKVGGSASSLLWIGYATSPTAITITSGTINIAAGTGKIEIDSNDTPNGLVTGAGNGLTLDGGGTLVFGGYGSSNISGNVNINAGILVLQGNSVLTPGARTTIASGAEYRINSSNQATYVNPTLGGLSGGGLLTVGTDYTTSKVSINVATAESYNFSGNLNFASTSSSAYFVKSGAGTQILSGSTSNVYAGVTTVQDGVLALAKTNGADALAGDVYITGGSVRLDGSNQIANTANLILAGGQFDASTSSETMALFSLDSTSSFSLTGGGADRLVFDNSSSVDWGSGAVLTIFGLVEANSIRFGTDATGLTAGQLGQIQFNSYAGPVLIDSNGYIYTASMVPEPGSIGLAALGLIGVAVLKRRKEAIL